MSIKNNL